MNGYIKKQSLMDFCDNTADKTVDNNDIARFPIAPVVEIDRVLEIINKHIKEAQKTDDDISMLCAVMADVEALKGEQK